MKTTCCSVCGTKDMVLKTRVFSFAAVEILQNEGYESSGIHGYVCNDCYQEMRELLMDSSLETVSKDFRRTP